jgi:ATP-binding cassette subfamily F protein 3
MESIESFTRALENYDGSVLLVSHNRYLVDRVATRVLELKPRSMEMFDGSYREFLEKVGVDHLSSRVDLPGGKPEKVKSTPSYREAKEQKKIAAANRQAYSRAVKPLRLKSRRLEEKISQLEAEITAIKNIFADPDYFQQTKAEEVWRQERKKQKLEVQLAGFYEQWEAANLEIETQKEVFDIMAENSSVGS